MFPETNGAFKLLNNIYWTWQDKTEQHTRQHTNTWQSDFVVKGRKLQLLSFFLFFVYEGYLTFALWWPFLVLNHILCYCINQPLFSCFPRIMKEIKWEMIFGRKIINFAICFYIIILEIIIL